MKKFYQQHRKWIWIVSTVLFFVCIFLLSIKSNDNSDTFYHVKAGEIFFKNGILHKDIFSFTAKGREWFPYEWLFEIIVYIYQAVLGYGALPFLVAGMGVLQIALLAVFFRKLFKLPLSLNLFLCFLYFMWTYELISGRPQLFVMPIFSFTLLSILLYIKKNKNILWITLPLTWMLANMHGSMVYNIYFFFSYAILCFLFFLLKRNTQWLQKTKVLFLYGILTAAVTILPPVWFDQYRLLLIFAKNISLIQSLIAEWAPMTKYSYFDIFYYFSTFLGMLPLIVISIKEKNYIRLLLISPLFVFMIIPFVAFRNTLTAYIVLIVIFAWGMSLIDLKKLPRWQKVFGVLIGIAALLFYGNSLYVNKTYLPKADIPFGPTQFLLNHNLNGNMFNSFTDGAYLIYRLYPKYKVFLDLRVDVYICCEIPKDKQIVDNLYLRPVPMARVMTKNIFDPYNISFAILPTRGSLLALQQVLTEDPTWQLVYWDDSGSIFIRKNGKNNPILKEYGVTAATPFGENPVESKNYTQATKEYLRMISFTDSARSRNALGYIYLIQKQYDKAEQEFKKAIAIDPTFDSPYGNLAEIALYKGDYKSAIDLYQKAKFQNGLRAYTYLRLAQIYIKYDNNIQKARDTLQEGMQYMDNKENYQALQNALSQISY